MATINFPEVPMLWAFTVVFLGIGVGLHPIMAAVDVTL
jgi:hypothetical protein